MYLLHKEEGVDVSANANRFLGNYQSYQNGTVSN
jgi:hypothetical protein